MTVLAPTAWWKGLGGLTRTASDIEGLAWALYDFANTIYLLALATANFAYQAALIYYDVLLPDVAHPRMRGRLSGVGVALGYCGTLLVGGLLLLGLTIEDERSTPATFALVAGLFLVFSGPLFLAVRERRRGGVPFSPIDAVRSWRQLGTTLQHARSAPGLLRFIVARFFYSDPVNTTIAVMSAFAVHAVGFTEGEALQVLLILTVVAVLASFGWGFLADRWGPRRTLFAVLGTWAIGLSIIASSLPRFPSSSPAPSSGRASAGSASWTA